MFGRFLRVLAGLEFSLVGVRHHEHHRHLLHLAVFVSFHRGHPGECSHIGIPGAVHNDLRSDGLSAGLALNHHPGDGVVLLEAAHTP